MAENVEFLLIARDLTAGAFNSVRSGLNGLGAQLISVRGLLGSLAGVAGASAFVAGVKAAAQAADEAAKMGDKVGITTEKLIGMQHAGELAGASNQALAQGFKSLANATIEAVRGSDEYSRAFKMLNLNAAEFARLPVDQQLETIIDKLGQVENVTARNYAANKLLGRNYQELLGLVVDGSQQFREAQKDAEAWGLAINRVDAAKIEMMNDAVTRGIAAMKGLFTTIAINVAPVVKLLADSWADSAREANGFKAEVSAGMETVVRGVAYATNIVRGLEFAWAGLKYVIATVVDAGVEGIKSWADAIGKSKVVEWAQYIPGPVGVAARALRYFGTEGSDALSDFAASTAAAVEAAKKELDDLAARGLVDPDELVKKFNVIKAVMDREAREIAARRAKFLQTAPVELPQRATDDKFAAELQKKVERIQLENMTERDLLQQHLDEKQSTLDIAYANNLVSLEEYEYQRMVVESKYAEALSKLDEEEYKRRYQISTFYRQLDLNAAAFFFGQLGALMQSKNKTMFEIGKKAAIAETIIQTYRAAQGAYAALAPIPIIGPALGIAAAAAAIVAGMARVQAIKSQQFDSGAAASPVFQASPTTGQPTAPISPVATPAGPGSGAQAQPRIVNVTFFGDGGPVSQEWLRNTLIPGLNEAIGYGVTINLTR